MGGGSLLFSLQSSLPSLLVVCVTLPDKPEAPVCLTASGGSIQRQSILHLCGETWLDADQDSSKLANAFVQITENHSRIQYGDMEN